MTRFQFTRSISYVYHRNICYVAYTERKQWYIYMLGLFNNFVSTAYSVIYCKVNIKLYLHQDTALFKIMEDMEVKLHKCNHDGTHKWR
jgi:hypothetical protein